MRWMSALTLPVSGAWSRKALLAAAAPAGAPYD
jgi:hypothetical protein